MPNGTQTPTGTLVGGTDRPSDPVDDADPDELLSLLGDEYTRQILSTLGEDALCAREIAERAGISCPTVYRRLNRLVSAGVVETGMAVDRSGHHRKQFRIAVADVEIRLDGDLLVAADDESTSDETERVRPAAPPR
jgi:predicted transcriptional regulator